MKNAIYYVWLSRLFPLGSDKPNQILLHYDNIEDFYKLDKEKMFSANFLDKDDVNRIKSTSLATAEKILKDCEELDIKLTTIADDNYPARLRYIYAPPVVLYYKGDIDGLDDELVLTVVGTRKPSDYGLYVAQRMSAEFAQAGAVVVSGCAAGIDTAAHQGALNAGKRTVAVLGCGVDVDYPKQNTKLKNDILVKGALISEIPPKIRPSTYVFPVRNRIMAGLCDGVVVVEAPIKSGSLITAEHAAEQGKDLFMVAPTNIYSSSFMGVARYIRDGAITVMSSKDVLSEYYNKYAAKLDALRMVSEAQLNNKKEELKNSPQKNTVQKKDDTQKVEQQQNSEKLLASIVASLDELCLKVYNSLDDTPLHIDEIIEKSDITMNQFFSTVTKLEIMGIVESYAGRRYGKVNKVGVDKL
ncbi:MAG: DNA-processing protein DprA [Oscillospiraceae bacterium]